MQRVSDHGVVPHQHINSGFKENTNKKSSSRLSEWIFTNELFTLTKPFKTPLFSPSHKFIIPQSPPPPPQTLPRNKNVCKLFFFFSSYSAKPSRGREREKALNLFPSSLIPPKPHYSLSRATIWKTPDDANSKSRSGRNRDEGEKD